MSHDKRSISGDHIISAGGDVTISGKSDKTLKEQLEELFDAIDKRLLSVVGTISSATRSTNEDTFSCQKMMRSLINIGIPHAASIEVIEGVESRIISEHRSSGKISTSDIRKAVQDSIYNLSSKSYGGNNLQFWGDTYVRRYGDFHRRISIIKDDGTIEFLDYNFLKNSLVPELIYKVYAVNIGGVDNLITPTQIQPMAENILEHIKSLNLCFIHYKTLFWLALDLAIQPPHPWLVDDDSAERTTSYGVERATDHYGRMEKYKNTKKVHQYWHSIDECLYHSCAMVLAYYRMFIGCLPVSPAMNLLNYLKLIKSRCSVNLWKSSRISQIESDLASLDYKFGDLINQLERVIKYRNDKKKIKQFSKEVSYIFNLSVELVKHRRTVDEILQKCTISVSDGNIFLSLIQSTLKKVKGLRIRDEDQEIEEKMFWVIHQINTPIFRDVGAKILVIPVFISSIKSEGNYQPFISQKIEFLESSGRYVNSAIFVVFEPDVGEFRSCVRRACGKGYRTVVTSFFRLLQINQAIERENIFEDIFVDC